MSLRGWPLRWPGAARGARRAGVALLVLLIAGAAALPGASRPTVAAEPHGAGLVVRHGDGRVVYAYVEFTEESITGEDLLVRSGLPQTLAPFGGLGVAVCSLDGEGCPADNCFCQSYGSPSYYWHYYRLNADGTWSSVGTGPSSHTIRDGDVVGWSWTAGDSGLPPISIDEIARLNGVDRSAPSSEPTAPAQPTPTPEPTPTPLPTSTPTPVPTPTPAPTPTPEPTESATSPTTPTPVPQAVTEASPTPSLAPTPTATPVGTPPGTPSPAASATSAATPPGSPVARAVVVDPSGSVTPVDVSDGDTRGFDATSYLAFAVILAAVGGVAAWAIVQRRRGVGP